METTTHEVFPIFTELHWACTPRKTPYMEVPKKTWVLRELFAYPPIGTQHITTCFHWTCRANKTCFHFEMSKVIIQNVKRVSIEISQFPRTMDIVRFFHRNHRCFSIFQYKFQKSFHMNFPNLSRPFSPPPLSRPRGHSDTEDVPPAPPSWMGMAPWSSSGWCPTGTWIPKSWA